MKSIGRLTCVVVVWLATLNVVAESSHAAVGQQLVVDTIAAMEMIGITIDKINAEPQNHISSLRGKIGALESRITSNQKRSAHVTEIKNKLSSFSSKNKNPEERDQIIQFIDSCFRIMPDDFILAYCKEKDVEKALSSKNSDEQLKKLKEKAAEKIIKNAKKGDFSGYAYGCADYILNEADFNIARLTEELTAAQRELDAESLKLVQKPEAFTSSAWFEFMGETEVPTKRIPWGATGLIDANLSYQQLIDKFCPEFYQREEFETKISAVGRFNGLIKDRIGVFPANVTTQDYWQYPSGDREKGRFDVYDKVLIISENGTVPPFEFPFGFKTWGEIAGVEIIHTYWDETDKKIDGISVLTTYPESVDGKKTFMYFDGNSWKITLPNDAEFLSYNESIARMRNNGTTPQMLTLSDDYLTYSFLVVTDRLIGHPDDQESATKVILKYLDTENKSEGYCVLEIPGFTKIYVDDYNGLEHSGPVIVAEGSANTGGKSQKKKFIYQAGFNYEYELALESLEIGGKEFSNMYDVILIAEGTLNETTGKWRIKEIEQDHDGDF